MVAPLVVGELLACLCFSEFVPIVLRLRKSLMVVVVGLCRGGGSSQSLVVGVVMGWSW